MTAIKRTVVGSYLLNVLIAFDQLANALSGGDRDETLSSTAAKNRDHWFWGRLAGFLDFVDNGHSADALEEDEGQYRVISPGTQAWVLIFQIAWIIWKLLGG